MAGEEVELECEGCGRLFTWDKSLGPEPDLCNSCREGKAMSSIEPPEGGWPRGSDMDRI